MQYGALSEFHVFLILTRNLISIVISHLVEKKVIVNLMMSLFRLYITNSNIILKGTSVSPKNTGFIVQIILHSVILSSLV